MTKNKLALAIKLAQKLSDEALMKIASENLTLDEIKKVAFTEGLDALWNAGAAIPNALGSATAGAAGPFGDAAGRLGGAWDATKALGSTAMKHKGTAAGLGVVGGLGTAAALYLAHKALQNMYGGAEDEGHERIASAKAELPVELRAKLDKLAEDPGVAAACYTLAKHGLI